MRICNRCGQEKPLIEFHRDQSRRLGRAYVCKSCEGKRERSGKHEIISEASREKIRLRHRRDYWVNRHKYTAKRMVEALVKTGDIKQQPCVECGSPKSMAHHPDYAKPLEVIWLCHKDHAKAHKQMRSHV